MTFDSRSVLCDDIRREDNGKLLLVGVYDGMIFAESCPTELSFCLWAAIGGLEKGRHNFSFSVGVAGGPKTTTDGVLEVDYPNLSTSLFFIGFPLKVEEPGDLIAHLAIDGVGEAVLLKLPIQAANEAEEAPGANER